MGICAAFILLPGLSLLRIPPPTEWLAPRPEPPKRYSGRERPPPDRQVGQWSPGPAWFGPVPKIQPDRRFPRPPSDPGWPGLSRRPLEPGRYFGPPGTAGPGLPSPKCGTGSGFY
ncbi:MAG: hypothetical protein AMJ56_17135 [Anaerolineae bacterium SG8_19]|nr:MAG: hypothetical protein AMJ56_17135 [Anaerolineae bacterium SG8_19]